ARLPTLRHEDVDGLPAVLRLREHIAEGDVGQMISIIIDVDAVDCVGMECVSVGIRVQDDNGSAVGPGRLKRVQVAEIKPFIAQRRAETESGEMVRHLPFSLRTANLKGPGCHKMVNLSCNFRSAPSLLRHNLLQPCPPSVPRPSPTPPTRPWGGPSP